MLMMSCSLFNGAITSGLDAAPLLSPTTDNVGPYAKPPLASLGILVNFIPKLPPPIQSGMSMFILFIPSITLLSASMMRFSGAFAMLYSPSNTPLNMSFMPPHALCQSPVNTPAIKLMSPLNVVFRLPISSPIVSNTELNITLKLPAMYSVNGRNTSFHK
ncbi:hypothetical protein D3C76_1252100 [compost metagenome]